LVIRRDARRDCRRASGADHATAVELNKIDLEIAVKVNYDLQKRQ
jgi:hypothetical protein